MLVTGWRFVSYLVECNIQAIHASPLPGIGCFSSDPQKLRTGRFVTPTAFRLPSIAEGFSSADVVAGYYRNSRNG